MMPWLGKRSLKVNKANINLRGRNIRGIKISKAQDLKLEKVELSNCKRKKN